MSWKDKTELLMGHCSSESGFGEILTFSPKVGESQTFMGIWSDVFTSVDPDQGIEVMSHDPNIGVRQSDFNQIPIRGDIFFRGLDRYEAREIQPDGESGIIIILEKKEAPSA